MFKKEYMHIVFFVLCIITTAWATGLMLLGDFKVQQVLMLYGLSLIFMGMASAFEYLLEIEANIDKIIRMMNELTATLASREQRRNPIMGGLNPLSHLFITRVENVNDLFKGQYEGINEDILLESMTQEELENEKTAALKNEDYERATKIRNIMEARAKKGNKE